jgi:iron(II)-dependent oxidoreductase
LPIEEEWEWAASGGKRKYPWGDKEPDETLANYCETAGHTTPVGAYPAGATPEGLLDMAGNVWEWMENRVREDKNWRGLRGGAWNYIAEFSACACRANAIPVGRVSHFGFRVVYGPSLF